MWILVRGIRVDHGARACPQSHDDHVGNHAPHANHDTTCLRSIQPHHALDLKEALTPVAIVCPPRA